MLAEWAAIAIENARLYQSGGQRSSSAGAELEATTEIARALGGETDLERILELIVKRGRTLLRARGLLILLRESDGLIVAAGAGEIPAKSDGARLRCGPERVRDALGLAARDGTDGAAGLPRAHARHARRARRRGPSRQRARC